MLLSETTLMVLGFRRFLCKAWAPQKARMILVIFGFQQELNRKRDSAREKRPGEVPEIAQLAEA